MAYIPYDQNNQQQEQGMNVLGQGQQAQQPAETPTTQTPPTSAPATPTQPSPEGARPKPQQKRRGSGAFTDLRKYIEQNRPQAQQIGQAVTGKVGQQTQQLGQQVQSQKEDLSRRIQENRARIGEQQQFGQQQIQQAQQLQVGDEGPQRLDPTQMSRFRDIMTGRESFGTTTGLDTTGAERAAGQLEQKARTAERADTRGQLLRETFGAPGRQYTAGQRSLDDIILASSQPAMQQMVGGLEQTAGEARQTIGEARRQAAEQMAGLGQFQKEAVSGLEEQLTGAREAAKTEAEQTVEREKQRIADLQEAIRTRQLTAEQAELLGLSEGARTYGMNLGRYFTQLDPTLQTALSQEQLLRADTLAQLGGLQGQQFAPGAQAGAFQSQLESAVKNMELERAAKERQYQAELNRRRQWEADRELLITLTGSPHAADQLLGRADLQGQKLNMIKAAIDSGQVNFDTGKAADPRLQRALDEIRSGKRDEIYGYLQQKFGGFGDRFKLTPEEQVAKDGGIMRARRGALSNILKNR